MSAADDIRRMNDTLKRYTQERLSATRILDIPGGWIEVARDADEAMQAEAAELFVRGHQIGARALMEEQR